MSYYDELCLLQESNVNLVEYIVNDPEKFKTIMKKMIQEIQNKIIKLKWYNIFEKRTLNKKLKYYNNILQIANS